MRNSNHPDGGTVLFTRTAMNAWIHGVKAGELNDLVQALVSASQC